MKSLEALHESLLNLSKSNSVHYEVTAAEIAATRFAILKIEGFEINEIEQAEYIAQAKIKQAIEKEVNALVEKRARLNKEIAELELRRDDLAKEVAEIEPEAADLFPQDGFMIRENPA